MLYEDYETDTSKENLQTVAKNVPGPLCLLGGWAVYLNVNKKFKAEYGSEYHGSKDIDLGFYFGENESEESIKNSMLNKSLIALKKINFIPQSFRLVQHYHREQKRALTEEESKKVATYNLFHLYVDLMVNRQPENIENVLGFIPADEPLLTKIFEEKLYKTTNEFGVEILLPNPEALLATKLNWVLERTKDHKRIKDIADIYALIFYSDSKIADLRSKVIAILGQKKTNKVISAFTDKDFEEASKAISVDAKQMENVIKSFIVTTIQKNVDTKKVQKNTTEEKWRIPFNVSFDTLKVIINSIYRKQGDQKHVTVDEIAKTSGLQKPTITSNFSFFKSIKLIDGDTKIGFKFTNLGERYSRALSLKNEDQIVSVTKEIVRNTHLNDIIDYIEAHENKVTLSDLFQYIKRESRAPDGPAPGEMPQPYATGTRALLIMLDIVKLLPEKIHNELLSKKKFIPKNISKKQPTSSKKTKSITTPEYTTELKEGIIGRVTVDGIGYVDIKDGDTLEIAKSYIDIIKKKLPTKDNDSN